MDFIMRREERKFRPSNMEELIEYQDEHYNLVVDGEEIAYWWLGDTPMYTNAPYPGIEISLERLEELQEHEQRLFNARWN
jgi:hypothetical protein